MIIVTEKDVLFIETKEDLIELLPEEARPYMDEMIEGMIEDAIEDEIPKRCNCCSYLEEAESETESYRDEISIAASYFFEDLMPILTNEQKATDGVKKIIRYLGEYH